MHFTTLTLIFLAVLNGIMANPVDLPGSTSAVENALLPRAACGGDGQRCCVKGELCNVFHRGGNCCAGLSCNGGAWPNTACN
ncbi:hypothetical protein C8R43DRAFT_1121204 [Mycena crocata]|nr:hypothetical protein C8R43DRAFT_1121204 [Mycena crocata]